MVRPGDRTSLKAGGDGCVPGVFEPEGGALSASPTAKSPSETPSFIARTDTLLRTQTITQKERYIPPFYRFCTISFATFATFATLAFSIHLLLRYLKRS